MLVCDPPPQARAVNTELQSSAAAGRWRLWLDETLIKLSWSPCKCCWIDR